MTGAGGPSAATSSAPGGARRPLLLRRDFALYWASGVLSNTGTWLQNVTASILVYTLTDSALLVGLLNAATFAPVLLLSVPAGSLADRVDRRRIVVVTSSVSLVAAVLLTVATGTGRADPVLLVAASLVMGSSYAFAKPALSSLLPALVAREEVPRATVVNTLQFTLGQVVGSSLAALLLAVATPAWAFGVNAATFLAPIVAMALLRLPTAPRRGARGRGGAREGLRFLRTSDGLLAVLGAVVLSNAASEALRTLAPAIAARVLGAGESQAALLVSSYSVGALAGLLVSGACTRLLTPFRAVAVAAVLQAAGLLGLALSSSLAVSLAAALPIGFAFAIVIPILNAALQDGSPDEFRGRVMAAFAMAHLGIRPVFALAAGALAAAGGPRLAVAVFAAFGLLAVALVRRRRPGLGHDVV